VYVWVRWCGWWCLEVRWCGWWCLEPERVKMGWRWRRRSKGYPPMSRQRTSPARGRGRAWWRQRVESFAHWNRDRPVVSTSVQSSRRTRRPVIVESGIVVVHPIDWRRSSLARERGRVMRRQRVKPFVDRNHERPLVFTSVQSVAADASARRRREWRRRVVVVRLVIRRHTSPARGRGRAP
jgi:hypothetical protein